MKMIRVMHMRPMVTVTEQPTKARSMSVMQVVILISMFTAVQNGLAVLFVLQFGMENVAATDFACSVAAGRRARS